MLSFKSNFSLSSFTFIKRLFSSSLLSPISVLCLHICRHICISEVIDISHLHIWGYWYFWGFWYLRLFIFLPAVLIPACASSNPAFLMMYFAYKLISRVTIYSLDLLLSWFGASLLFHVQFCYFLTCIQISQEADQVVWYSHLFKNFPQFVVIHTVKGFGIDNKAEVDVFHFFDDLVDVADLIPGSSAFSKSSLNIWKFMVHVMLKPGLKNYKHYFASVWDESNGVIVWAFFGIAFLWDWNENWPFPVLWPLLSIPSLLAYWV